MRYRSDVELVGAISMKLVHQSDCQTL
jgi:hypothetical protein